MYSGGARAALGRGQAVGGQTAEVIGRRLGPGRGPRAYISLRSRRWHPGRSPLRPLTSGPQPSAQSARPLIPARAPVPREHP
jgi:hypothetical protein